MRRQHCIMSKLRRRHQIQAVSRALVASKGQEAGAEAQAEAAGWPREWSSQRGFALVHGSPPLLPEGGQSALANIQGSAPPRVPSILVTARLA